MNPLKTNRSKNEWNIDYTRSSGSIATIVMEVHYWIYDIIAFVREFCFYSPSIVDINITTKVITGIQLKLYLNI
jgi:hypothetical protein